MILFGPCFWYQPECMTDEQCFGHRILWGGEIWLSAMGLRIYLVVLTEFVVCNFVGRHN